MVVVLEDDVRAHRGVRRDAKRGGYRTFAEADFYATLHKAAIAADRADGDGDGRLSFDEVSELVREREEGEHSEAELAARFTAMDADASGHVSMAEYLAYAMRDALMRSSERVIDLFRTWDVDVSGGVEKGEFAAAVRRMGFVPDPDVAASLFEALDADGSGSLSYDELNRALRHGPGSGHDATIGERRALRKRGAAEQEDGAAQPGLLERMSAPSALDLNGGGAVRLEDVTEELWLRLASASGDAVSLFEQIDVDGDGRISAAEFRGGMALLGFLPRGDPKLEGLDLKRVCGPCSLSAVLLHLSPQRLHTKPLRSAL
jgi:Ca2+-binding EF-hand superfamily protein